MDRPHWQLQLMVLSAMAAMVAASLLFGWPLEIVIALSTIPLSIFMGWLGWRDGGRQ